MLSHGTFSAPIFRSFVGCEFRANMRVDECPAVAEDVDRGVSGAKYRRPALDNLVRDAPRHRFHVVVCRRLDRLGRDSKHLLILR